MSHALHRNDSNNGSNSDNDIGNNDNNISNNSNSDKYLIGYLPWKLMLSDVILEERDSSWLEKIKEPVNNAINIAITP